MKKLEDIPKKEIFEVPGGYFEKLPGIIQSRVTSPEKSWVPSFRPALRLAVPVLLMAIAVGFWIQRSDSNVSVENILASIQTEDLITYLNEGDLSTEELLDHVELDAEDVSRIEESVYGFQLNDSDIEDFLNEIEP